METSLRPYFRETSEHGRLEGDRENPAVKSKQEQRIDNVRDSQILREMWILVGYGLTVFLGGFAFWGVDRVYCSTLRTWRRQIGMPWGFFLEGHGWWHLMTGVGAYCYIVWGIHLRHVLNGDQDKYEMVWPHLWTLPEIIRLSSSGSLQRRGRIEDGLNGNAGNGHVKKS